MNLIVTMALLTGIASNINLTVVQPVVGPIMEPADIQPAAGIYVIQRPLVDGEVIPTFNAIQGQAHDAKILQTTVDGSFLQGE